MPESYEQYPELDVEAYRERMRNPPRVEPGLPAASYPACDYELEYRRGALEKAFELMHSRPNFVREFGFVLLTQEVLEALTLLLQGKRVVDVGAGTGYLAHRLAQGGVDITAVDLSETDEWGWMYRYIETLDQDALEVLPGDFEAVILSWPDYASDFGYRVLKALRPGQMLIYEGEGEGGCTGDEQFHQELMEDHWLLDVLTSQRLNEHHRQFFGIHDRWHVYIRSGA